MCPQVECLNPSEKVIIFMCFLLKMRDRKMHLI